MGIGSIGSPQQPAFFVFEGESASVMEKGDPGGTKQHPC